MFRNVLGAVALVVGMVAAPAFAADLLIVDDSPIYDPAPVSSWDGFYIGAWGGYRTGNITNTACVGVCANNIALNGLFGGLTAGYDMQFDENWVFGGFVTLPLLKPTGSATLGVNTFTVTPNWAITAAVRVGYAVGAFLPYGFVGLGAANVTVTPSMVGLTPSSATHTGLVAGAGLEYTVTENISIDGRYTLGLLGSGTYNFGGGASSYTETSHNFSVGVNYRF